MADWKISVPDEMDLYPLVQLSLLCGTGQAKQWADVVIFDY